jgi:hypothetical protein
VLGIQAGTVTALACCPEHARELEAVLTGLRGEAAGVDEPDDLAGVAGPGSRLRLRCLRRPATVEKSTLSPSRATHIHRRLRPAVRVDRGQYGKVAAVEQPADPVVECNAHRHQRTRMRRPAFDGTAVVAGA